MSKNKKRARSQRKNEITKGIFTVLENEPNKSFNYKQIASKLDISDTQGRNELIKKLGQLKQKERITEVEQGKFKKNTVDQELLTGKLDLTTSGNGYIIVEGQNEDIFVPNHKLNRALHGDTVSISLKRTKKKGRPEGAVVEVLERKKIKYVGIFDKQKTFAFVRPTDSKMYTDIFVPLEKSMKANDGDKVLVELGQWPSDADSPYGKVIEVLGKPGEHNTEIHAILAEYGLPYEFPYEVEQFANNIDTSIKKEEILKRRDMREVLTFTIDPKDAKDFDDALSFQNLENGNYEIGVHIADVSHYVKPNTILEEEGYNRATSVYLVDRVVPMLPEVLSNNACSLRPNEEKYTFSAIFEIDKNAQVKNQWFGRTVINSNERFAYEEAQHIIETEQNKIPKNVSIRDGAYNVSNEVVEAVLTFNGLAKQMRSRRMDRGAISFDKIEVRFNLDANNEPESVYFKEAKDANKLIEEFMLLANRKVAEFIGKQ
ncbi:MAG: ribonuclease R, partial [Croceitalea sp.]|nr:ribonuclease R [Croceitalea sp.]